MSLQPENWTWKDHYNGSTFSAKNIKFNFDITGAVITCHLKSIIGNVIYEWKTNLNITVLDLINGEIVLNQINKFRPSAGNYSWDLQINFSNGSSETYLKGTQKVVQDITVTP